MGAVIRLVLLFGCTVVTQVHVHDTEDSTGRPSQGTLQGEMHTMEVEDKT